MEKLPEAYQQQIEYVRIIWREKTYGLDRLVRLFLGCAQFGFPDLMEPFISYTTAERGQGQ